MIKRGIERFGDSPVRQTVVPDFDKMSREDFNVYVIGIATACSLRSEDHPVSPRELLAQAKKEGLSKREIAAVREEISKFNAWKK